MGVLGEDATVIEPGFLIILYILYGDGALELGRYLHVLPCTKLVGYLVAGTYNLEAHMHARHLHRYLRW